MKNNFSSSKTLHKPHVQHYTGNNARTLESRLTHALCYLHLFRVDFPTHSLLLVLFLEQTSEDCIGNTGHSNVNVNAECNGK